MILIEFIDVLTDDVTILTQREQFTREQYRDLITSDPDAGGWPVVFRVDQGTLSFYRRVGTGRYTDIWLGSVVWPERDDWEDEETIIRMAALRFVTETKGG